MRLTASADTSRHNVHPHAHNRPNKIAYIIVYDTATALAAGDGAEYMRVPNYLDGMNLVLVEACVFTASTSGAVSIMIHNVTDAVDMLSTALTIDANETDSKDAATPAVVDTANDDVATGDQLRIDIDGAGTGTKGLHIQLSFRRG